MPHRVLWSSDHHFGHRAILDERMSVRRPFASIEEHDETLIPKFRKPEHIQIVVAGGSAGRFSAVVAGWSFSKGSNLVMRKIR